MNTFFTLTHNDKNSRARTGVVHTEHGDIQTPVFMPVGTQATVKSLDQTDLQNLDAEIILGNTYHLHLRPGEDLIAEFGGLHKFMHWDRPILTDSGGFQVFSLGTQKEKSGDIAENDTQGKLVAIDEDGVTFRSHIDGSTHRFTPESAIATQHKIGADIIMAFDECTSDTADKKYTMEAMERTHRWATRSMEAHQKFKPTDYKRFLFGIIQGANHKHLRETSAKFIAAQNFDGIAIGGESIGYNMAATADMFDCVAPTRIARNGTLYVHKKIDPNLKISITNAQFRNDSQPIDPECLCFTCLNHSRAYVHHLFRANEMLAYRLATLHNLHFFLNLMRDMRQAINVDNFLDFKKEWLG